MLALHVGENGFCKYIKVPYRSFLCQKKFLPASDSACLRTAGGVGRVHVQHAQHAGEAVRLVPAKQPLDEAVLGVGVGETLVTINTVTTNCHLRGV